MDVTRIFAGTAMLRILNPVIFFFMGTEMVGKISSACSGMDTKEEVSTKKMHLFAKWNLC